jgi:hypothetical protein
MKIKKQDIKKLNEVLKNWIRLTEGKEEINEAIVKDAKKWYLGIRYAVEQPDCIYYKGKKFEKNKLYDWIQDKFSETLDMDDKEFKNWLVKNPNKVKNILIQVIRDSIDPLTHDSKEPIWNGTYDEYLKTLNLKQYKK